MSTSVEILTVTLNPAIDRTVFVPGFRTGAVNRVDRLLLHAGGKGINVASLLADWGCSVCATGFLGQQNATLFEQLFAQKNIRDACLRIPGATRTGIKIIDENAQETTDINFPGITPAPRAIDELMERIAAEAVGAVWLVLAGSLPRDAPEDLYQRIIEVMRPTGIRIALDTSGPALIQGVRAKPHLVKPNIEELGQLLGPNAMVDPLTAARELLARDIETVIVSMGEKGALFMETSDAVMAQATPERVVSTVGAGDALLAGAVSGACAKLPLESRARRATAFAVSVLSRVGLNLPEPEKLTALERQVCLLKAERQDL